MEENLKSLYYNPKYGLKSFNKFYINVKEKYPDYKYADVKIFYNNQLVNQIYAKPSTKFLKIKCLWNTVGCKQIDLLEIGNFSHQNKGYKYLLNVIDIYSRYAWSIPLPNKTAAEVAKALDIVLKELMLKFPDNFFTVTSDKSNEFEGAVKKLLSKNNIIHYYNNPNKLSQHTHMGIIERFNQTIMSYIKKYMNANNTLTFVDKLPDFIENYNNSIHSTIHAKPADIYNGKIIPIDNNDEKNVSNLLIGDKVRYALKLNTFDKKGFTPKFSPEIYTIVEQIGNSYQLEDNNKIKLKHLYLERELLKINKTETNNNTPAPTLRQQVKKVKQLKKFETLQKQSGVDEKKILPDKEKRVRKLKKILDL